MITNRYMQESDYQMLDDSLALDKYHQGTTLEFFKEEGTVTSVYSFDDEVILFARGRPLFQNNLVFIQLDLQFLDNDNRAKNLITMLTGFYELERKAREEGFSGFVFHSNVPLLRKFCIRRLGFTEWDGDFLFKALEQAPIDKGPGVEI